MNSTLTQKHEECNENIKDISL